MKKIISVLICCLVIFVSTPAFAATNTTKAIENPGSGWSYLGSDHIGNFEDETKTFYSSGGDIKICVESSYTPEITLVEIDPGWGSSNDDRIYNGIIPANTCKTFNISSYVDNGTAELKIYSSSKPATYHVYD